ncbi:MAG TPA: redoxin domain-containing protein [Oscillatoriaceae cyanobacterium M7585_C2015_266]|nr:redoxin domain-containing protein [Oscillatoriaceae cyanobacterium M7585_C2015_266]
MNLTISDIAPDFSLPDVEGNIISLASLRGKRVILYFYPRDNISSLSSDWCRWEDRKNLSPTLTRISRRRNSC